MRFFSIPFHCLLFLILLVNCGHAEDISPEIAFAANGDQIYSMTSFEIPSGYHAYSHVPGGAGMPTKLSLAIAGNQDISTFYPAGQETRDTLKPEKTISIYTGLIQILAIFPAEMAGKPYDARLNLLLCSDKRCVPIKKTMAGTIPENPQPLSESGWNLRPFASVIANYTPDSPLQNQAIAREHEPSPTQGQNESNVPPTSDASPASQDQQDDFDLSLEPVYFSDHLEVFSLWEAVLLGLIAGLLLNAMPCVLPVLGLKINALLGSGNRNDKKSIVAFRKHNIWFICGVMTFFSFLALLVGAADLLWGQLFQSQVLVLLILMLVFLMGLSMFNVFTLPVLNLKLGESSRNPSVQAFCSGLLCTFLATPCSGPMLGGVLAWAFTQSLPFLLVVFWSVGVGMSLPYIAFCIWPHLGRILPRPGNWMHIFETILGFLLLGTSLYLLSILPQNKRMHILCALLGIAFCAWILGRFCNLFSPLWKRVAGALFGLAVITFSVLWVMQPAQPEADWKSFDADTFTANYGKRNMLLEFTADWCPNCKYLEATVLTEEFLVDLQKKHDLELVRVDITNPSPYAEKLLNMLGSKSIPVTALFPKGENFHQPMILRDLYSRDSLEKAIKNIF